MNDRELLELAAKAAGIECERTPVGFYLREEDRNWNPLTDDGDALRLAVKLELQITLWDKYVRVWLGEVEALEDYNGDPYTATRRAIVRAAAAIGQEMK